MLYKSKSYCCEVQIRIIADGLDSSPSTCRHSPTRMIYWASPPLCLWEALWFRASFVVFLLCLRAQNISGQSTDRIFTPLPQDWSTSAALRYKPCTPVHFVTRVAAISFFRVRYETIFVLTIWRLLRSRFPLCICNSLLYCVCALLNLRYE